MPPPVLIPDVRTLDGLATDVPAGARALAEAFWPGGLTLIVRAQPSLAWDLGETRGTVALRVPDHETALALLRRTGPLAVSSANRTGSPAAVTAQEAYDQLGDSVDRLPRRRRRPRPGRLEHRRRHRRRRCGWSAPGASASSSCARSRPSSRRRHRVRVYLLALLIAATVAYLMTPLARWCALRWGAITAVRDRDVHAIPTPRLGGMAMFAGILVGDRHGEPAAVPRAASTPTRGRSSASSAARRSCARSASPTTSGTSTGSPSSWARCSPAGSWRGRACCSTSCPSAELTLGSTPCGLFLTVLTVVIAMNAVNFVDGLDGLAAGVLAIGGTAFFLYAYLLTAGANPGAYVTPTSPPSCSRCWSARASASCRTTSTRPASSWATRAPCCSASCSAPRPSS